MENKYSILRSALPRVGFPSPSPPCGTAAELGFAPSGPGVAKSLSGGGVQLWVWVVAPLQSPRKVDCTLGEQHKEVRKDFGGLVSHEKAFC